MQSLARARASKASLATPARPNVAPLRPVSSAVCRSTRRSVSTTASPLETRRSRPLARRAAAAATTAPGPAYDEPEATFLETNGAPASLAFNVLMGATIVYLPLTIAALGRAAWIKIRFTNKRVEVINTSPLFKGTQQVAYSQVKDVKSAPRGFGQWGDIVLFLKGGGTVELTGLPRHREIVEFIRARSEEARRAELEAKLREAGEAA